MRIINKGKKSVTLCKPGHGLDSVSPVCIDVEPKQVVGFPENEARDIIVANPSLKEKK